MPDLPISLLPNAGGLAEGDQVAIVRAGGPTQRAQVPVSGGQVASVQAGSGIAIDATDPANPIVSATAAPPADTREFVMQAGRNGNVSAGSYLELSGLTMNGAERGLVLAYDCVLTAISIARSDNDDATILVQKNGATELDQFTSETAVVATGLGLSFQAGDVVAVQCSPTSANTMSNVGVTLWFERTV